MKGILIAELVGLLEGIEMCERGMMDDGLFFWISKDACRRLLGQRIDGAERRYKELEKWKTLNII